MLAPYQRAVAESGPHVPTALAADLAEIVDHLADLAGNFWSFVLYGGAAWRYEIALARSHRRHLSALVSQPYQVLLGGLGVSETTPGHSVHSIDWFRETIGELPSTVRGPRLAAVRHEEAVSARRAAEDDCRKAVAAQPRLLARFKKFLALAQQYAVIRAEHAAWFTLAWPVLRKCTWRLGDLMVSDGLLDKADDIFFISRAELADYLAGRRPQELTAQARGRMAAWEHSRRLVPPLTLGKPPLLLAKVLLSSPGGGQARRGGRQCPAWHARQSRLGHRPRPGVA